MRRSPRAGSGAVRGWIRRPDERDWLEAEFELTTGPKGPALQVRTNGDGAVQAIDLDDITAMDELTAVMARHDRVELAVRRTPVFQAVWLSSFTQPMVDALVATVPPPAAFGGSPEPEGGEDRPRSGRAMSGVIGALLLTGCGALIAGTLTLDTEGGQPTTSPTTTAPTTTSAAPTTTGGKRTTIPPTTAPVTTAPEGTETSSP